jgi:SpoVK/Ycf46/Vps4 family AAA+-type ATPase
LPIIVCKIQAVFSLARKIAPCVIFIDEVDSLLNARRSDFASNTHREIVNQFMVEWDGLSSDNHGVILMAATNRPYDLDDAVLRRMPRRILGMSALSNGLDHRWKFIKKSNLFF